MKNITSIQKYAIELEKLGYMSLGEPLVFYKLHYGQEKVWIYLNLKNHGTQIILGQGTIETNKLGWFFRDQAKNGKVFTLSQFIREYEKITVNFGQPDDLRHHSAYLGRSSNTKCLTHWIAQSILEEDDVTYDYLPLLEESKHVATNLLKSTYDFIGRPETLAYLSRLAYFSSVEKAEFVDLPFEYMVKSFLPPHGYNSITLPEAANFTEKRSILELEAITALAV